MFHYESVRIHTLMYGGPHGGPFFFHVCPCLHVGFIYLQYVDGAPFKGVANLDLAYKLWVLCHQQVHEFIDLKWEEVEKRDCWLLGMQKSSPN